MALRYEDWKVVFLEQRATGTLRIWAEPFTHASRAQGLQS
jgi:arylsulfatase